MYSDKRAKVSSSEIPAYSNLIPETCSVDSPEIPVPGYFRLSQTYATSKNPDYDSEAMSPNTTLMQLNRVTPKAQSTPFVECGKEAYARSGNKELFPGAESRAQSQHAGGEDLLNWGVYFQPWIATQRRQRWVQ